MGELQGSRVGSRTRREAVLGVAALALGAGCSELTGPNPSEVADYSIPIDVHNNHDRGHTATVTIEGPDEREYKEFGVRVPPDTEVAVTPFTDLAPTGHEEFLVTATVDDLDVDPMTWTAEMNECFGQLEVVIDEDGSIFGGPVVC